MTEGRHYKVDFETFNQILGFGEERGFTYIHDKARAKTVTLHICGLIGEVQMGRSVE